MKSYKTVANFIKEHEQWEAELILLRGILKTLGMNETIKWGAPVYTIDGKNIVGLGAFKSYVGLWFFQGALLKDEKKVLVNAQEGKTVAMRQLRYNSITAIDESLVKNYVLEAIQNQKKGREIKPVKNKPLTIPGILKAGFIKQPELEAYFNKYTLSKKREFVEYIGSAKRESTQKTRLKKIIPMILQGIGLNDKYR
ncbi:YdeI/OmpD-associated family protein [Leptobacterium sp. I13]|uniref:YdeI/OmpD-associated family protein n=1 Tax=Leptobacterium meishanense TaxID=3128904 RepID=UPI0030EE228E